MFLAGAYILTDSIMSRNFSNFPPLPSDDEAIIFDNDLTSSTGLTVNRSNGSFSANGFDTGNLDDGQDSSITITGLTNQANLQYGGFISFDCETFQLAKDDSLDISDTTQSEGRSLANGTGVLLSCWGDGGNGERLQLYYHPTSAQLTLHQFNNSGINANTIFQVGITSVGKGDKTNVCLSFQGSLVICYVNGSEVARGTNTKQWDDNQFSTMYLGTNGAFGADQFGGEFKNLQIGLRPVMLATRYKTLTIWGDSFIEAGFGTLGNITAFGVREYDADMVRTVRGLFAKNNNLKLKIAPHGYSGYSWSDSNANPQTDNQAAVAAEGSEVLIMPNSINGVQYTSSLVSDYQSSLEAHIDYQVTNNTNLKKIVFTSMMPFSQNTANSGDRTSGVVEASNAVMAGLVDYVNANYPNIEAVFDDMFALTGGHNYPSSWTYGPVTNSDDPHPSTLGHYEIGKRFYNIF